MAMHIDVSATLDHPVEQVFALLTDVSRHPEWMEEVNAVTQPPQMPLGVGSTYELSAQFFGRKVTLQMIVIGFEQDRLLQLDSTGGWTNVTRWQVEPKGDSTFIRLDFDGEPGEMYDMIASGMKGQITRSFEAQLRNLDALLDGEPA